MLREHNNSDVHLIGSDQIHLELLINDCDHCSDILIADDDPFNLIILQGLFD